MVQIILASASPSRYRLLESVGIIPKVIVSGVNEESPEFDLLDPSELVLALATLKAQAVKDLAPANSIIIGCDSTFDVDGVSFGKPGTPEVAVERAKKISGRTGLLHTGHCIIDTERGIEIADRVTTKVTFTDMTDEEIHDYVASEEPLHVAGGFTLDGFGSPFIPVIEGDYTNVVGISMPFLRNAMKQLGYSWPQVKEMS